MPKLSRLAKKEKELADANFIREWKLFRACCGFFNLTLEDMYFHLSTRSSLDHYYPTLQSFRIAVNIRPLSIMRKEDLRETVLRLTSRLREDIAKCLATNNVLVVKEKWTI